MPTPEAQPDQGHPAGDQPDGRQLDLDSDAAVLDALRGTPRYREDGAPTGKSEEADPGDDNDEPTAEEGEGDDEGKEEDEDPEPDPEPKGYKAALTKMHAEIAARKASDARVAELTDIVVELAHTVDQLKKGEAPEDPKTRYLKAVKTIRESDSDEEGAEALRELIESAKGDKPTKAEVEAMVGEGSKKAAISAAGGPEPYYIGLATKWASDNLKGVAPEKMAKAVKSGVKFAIVSGQTPGPTHVQAALQLLEDEKPATAPKPAKPVPPGGRSAAARPATFSEPKLTPRNVFEDRFVSKG